MTPEYWFVRAAVAATLAKAAENIGDSYNAQRFGEAAVWYTAQGIRALASSAAEQN